MKVYKGGELTYELDDADSIVFSEETAPVSPEYVDLGLPSGTLWATFNVGASSPEEYGDYYAWGETETKSNYSWSTYFDTTDGGNTFTKYNHNGGKTTLDADDDVAHVKWGGSWRMPTHAEQQELIDSCTWNWTPDYNSTGVAGYIVTSKTNSNSIFLPAAGACLDTTSPLGAGLYGYYWSSSLYSGSSYDAYSLSFNSDVVGWDEIGRYGGLPVRPVMSPASTTTGTAKAKLDGTNEVDVTWVQLWKDGPKFATINVGVTDPEATGTAAYGGYYTWGGSTAQVNGSFTDDHNTGSASLSGTDDTATNLWGNNWRMPTKDELSGLKDNCTWSTFSSGYTITGKGDYASNSIFLPAAGYFYSDGKEVLYTGTLGNYWSSTNGGSDGVYNLYFESSDKDVFGDYRDSGNSVRPVLAE